LITSLALKLSPVAAVSYVVDVITVVTRAVLVARADLTDPHVAISPYKDK